jgi:hypothetical protein
MTKEEAIALQAAVDEISWRWPLRSNLRSEGT